MSTLEGVSIKAGNSDGGPSGGFETWYEFDNNPIDDDSGDAPDVWIVENKEVDQTHEVVFTGLVYNFT